MKTEVDALKEALKRAQENEQFQTILAEKYRANASAALAVADTWKDLYMQQLSIQNARTVNDVLVQQIEPRGQA